MNTLEWWMNPKDIFENMSFLNWTWLFLYVDLVGSTTMALEMPSEKIAIIISSFAQEMAAVIRQHHGYVLKFVGDAVIGYFVAEDGSPLTADNAVNCAKIHEYGYSKRHKPNSKSV